MYPRWVQQGGEDVSDVPLYSRLFASAEGWRVEQHGHVIAFGRPSVGSPAEERAPRARRRAESVWRSVAGSPRERLGDLLADARARLVEAGRLSGRPLEELALVRRLLQGSLSWDPYGEGGACLGCPFGVVLLVRPEGNMFRWMGTGLASPGGREPSLERAQGAAFDAYKFFKSAMVKRAQEYLNLRSVDAIEGEIRRLCEWAEAHGIDPA